MIGCGVPIGAAKPSHSDESNPGRIVSATVGTSGSEFVRLALVTTNGRSLPSRMSARIRRYRAELQVDASFDEVDCRLSRAYVGNVIELDVGLAAEQQG